MAIEYRVKETTAIIIEDGKPDPDDWKTVPAWSVTRIDSSMGWGVSKYLDRNVAELIAATLTAASHLEAP